MSPRMTSPTKPCGVVHPVPLFLCVSSKLGHCSGARVLSGPTRTQPSSSSRVGLFCLVEEVWFNPVFRSKNGDLDASDKMSNEKYHKVTSKNSLFHLKFKPRTGSKNAVLLKTTNFKAGKKTIGLTGMSAFMWHEKNVDTWFISFKKGEMIHKITCSRHWRGDVYWRFSKANNKDDILGCLSLSLTLQDFWKAHLNIRRRAWQLHREPGGSARLRELLLHTNLF